MDIEVFGDNIYYYISNSKLNPNIGEILTIKGDLNYYESKFKVVDKELVTTIEGNSLFREVSCLCKLTVTLI